MASYSSSKHGLAQCLLGNVKNLSIGIQLLCFYHLDQPTKYHNSKKEWLRSCQGVWGHQLRHTSCIYLP